MPHFRKIPFSTMRYRIKWYVIYGKNMSLFAIKFNYPISIKVIDVVFRILTCSKL